METIGNDRLKKAIERNRAKQAKKNGMKAKLPKSIEPSIVLPSKKTRTGSRNVVRLNPDHPLREDGMMGSNVGLIARKPKNKKSLFSRFKYSQPKSAPRSLKAKSAQKYRYIIPLCWGVMFLMGLRLIFSEGGIYAYYGKKNHLKDFEYRLNNIKKENQKLRAEVHRLKNDRGYQIQVTRENLGLIAPGEYLVLFASE